MSTTADKPLSTEKRNSLPSSSFCGPSKSFPVNDCAHYTAALRLLNRAKLSPATKAKVHACIERKGKSLGCGTKDSHTEAEIEALMASDVFESTREFLAWFADIEDAMVNPSVTTLL